jgi:hypothetical protein
MKCGDYKGFKIKMPLFFKRWRIKATIVGLAEHGRGFMFAAPVAYY